MLLEQRRQALELPLERLSATSMNLFVSCPEAFRQKYLLGVPDKFFGHTFMGSVNHATIAELLRYRLYNQSLPDDDKIKSLYRDFWAEKLEQEEPEWKQDDPAEMYVRGLNMAILYTRQVMPQIKPVAIEQKLEINLPGLPVPLVGYADVIEHDKVRERKTTHQKQTKPKSKWRFQARLYRLMTGLPVEWDVITRQVEPRIYTASDWPELRLGEVSDKTTIAIIYAIAERISSLYHERGTEQEWPLEGYFGDWACDYCRIGPKFLSTCSAWNPDSQTDRRKNGAI